MEELSEKQIVVQGPMFTSLFAHKVLYFFKIT